MGIGVCSTSINGAGDGSEEGLDGPHSIPLNAIEVHTRWENRREPV